MGKIKVEKPSEEKLKSLGVDKWSPWEYDDKETCYVLEGRVKVKTPNEEVEFGKGDLVTFPQGLKCTWNVIKKVRKVYKFG